AASAGAGGASRRRILATIFPTAALFACPLPVTAALTSVGVCRATGMPRRAAAAMTMPEACAVPITVLTLSWLKTRSTARTSGWCRSSQASMPSAMASRRWSSGVSGVVPTTVTSTSEARRFGSTSTTARPQRVSPGSTPTTRNATAVLVVRFELCHDLGGEVCVGVDVLHVVELLEGVGELEELAGRVGVELDLHRGDEFDLVGLVLDPGLLQCSDDGAQVGGLGVDLEVLAGLLDLVGAGLEDGQEDVVLGQVLRGQRDDALAGEQVGDRARVGDGAAVARDGQADLGGGAVLVVGQALDEQRRALRTAGLVDDLGVVDDLTGQAGAALDGTVDVVVGDRG